MGDEGARALGASCRMLQRVVLSFSRLTDDGVAALGATCAHVTHLDLSCTRVVDTWCIGRWEGEGRIESRSNELLCKTNSILPS